MARRGAPGAAAQADLVPDGHPMPDINGIEAFQRIRAMRKRPIRRWMAFQASSRLTIAAASGMPASMAPEQASHLKDFWRPSSACSRGQEYDHAWADPWSSDDTPANVKLLVDLLTV